MVNKEIRNKIECPQTGTSIVHKLVLKKIRCLQTGAATLLEKRIHIKE